MELENNMFAFYCPGCQTHHHFWIGAGQWTFNGNMDAPTVSPSVLVKWVKVPPGDNKTWEFDENQRIVGAKELRCHLFIRSGQLQFLGDCTHELKGITVPMEDVDG
jgi:hypothetical protein